MCDWRNETTCKTITRHELRDLLTEGINRTLNGMISAIEAMRPNSLWKPRKHNL